MKNNNKILSLLSRFVFGGAIVTSAMVALVYLYAARPLADDFERATCQGIVEAINTTSHYYLSWSGRWAGLGMASLGWSIIPQLTPNISIYYSMLLASVWLLMFAASVAIIRLLIGGTFFKSLLWTAIAALIYFSFYHDLAPTIYWLPGAAENALCVIFMSLAIWLVMSSMANGSDHGRLYYVGVFLCLLIAPGCHEFAGLVASAFFALMLAWCYFKREAIPKILLIALVFAIIGTAINVFSPGNEARADGCFPKRAIFEKINAFTIIILRTMRLALSPQILIGIPLVAIVIQKKPDALKRLLAYRKLAFAIGGMMILALIGTAMVYSFKLGGHPSARTINFFCSSILMVVLPAVVVIVAGYIHNQGIKVPSFVEHMLCILLGLTVILGPNLDKGLFSYKKGLWPWIKDQESRHALLLEHSKIGNEDVVIKPGPVAPHLLFTEWELSSDPECWQNKDQATYYGLRSIKMDEEK